jgi:hypothetical protein
MKSTHRTAQTAFFSFGFYFIFIVLLTGVSGHSDCFTTCMLDNQFLYFNCECVY